MSTAATDTVGPEVYDAINTFFLLIMCIIVFFMHAGFACLELGSIRVKNVMHSLTKNLLDSGWAALIYWAIGYAFANGADGNRFIGYRKFFLSSTPEEEFPQYFFSYVFAAAATTIVGGAVAERCRMFGYMLFMISMTGFIYPTSAYWVWSDRGWLADIGFIDYAGSTVVHCTGGSAALMGAFVMGPRLDRFGPRGRPIPGHSGPLVYIGYFILWFGFLAFNGVSEGGIAGPLFNPTNVSRAVINTVFAGASALIVAILVQRMSFKRTHYKRFGMKVPVINPMSGRWDAISGMNASLSGMVAICASAFGVEPWAAVVIGIVAGLLYFVSAALLDFLHIDDALYASAVHLGGGIWGTVAVGLFLHHDRSPVIPNGAILYAWDGDAFIQFGIQCIGCAVITVWALTISGAVFTVLRVLGILRESKKHELQGLDVENAQYAYPEPLTSEFQPDPEDHM